MSVDVASSTVSSLSGPVIVALFMCAGTSLVWLWLQRRRGAYSPGSKPPPAAKWPTDGVFTLESLARFDGVKQPLCLGICGKVVNCSISENIKPGEGYGKLWAGRDGTYAFALCSLKPEDANKLDWKLDDFTPEQFKALASWYKHFTTKYPVVGVLKEYEGWDFASVEEASVHETPFSNSLASNREAEAPEVLRAGDHVLIHGLKGRTDLNNQVGVLKTYLADKQRFAVELPGQADPLLLKPENVRKF